jgi:hypothetical protein
MAEIIIKRIEKQNSMSVNINIIMNRRNEGTISNNSTITLENIPIRVHEVYVSNLKGIYRYRKLKITITDNDK